MSKLHVMRRWLLVFDAPRGPWLVAALALLLSLPSLGLGLQTDEHMMRAQLLRGADWSAMFKLGPELATEFRAHGGLPWWSSPELNVRFMRPIAGWMHAHELLHWVDAAWAMHLVNALLYALIAGLAALTYRRLFAAHATHAAHTAHAAPQAGAGIAVATAAALLFAIDDAHAPSVGWISGRNTLLATAGVLGSLLAQHVASERGSLPMRLVSAACWAFALASGEAGVAGAAYLGAHALVLERGPLRARALTLAPHALVFCVYASLYFAGGYGVRGASWYRDSSAPGALLGSGLVELPLWVASQLGLGMISLALSYPESFGRVAGFLLAAPFLFVMVPPLRGDRLARFFALAFVGCLLPLFASVPQDRNLLAATFAGFGWIASFLALGPEHPLRRVRVTRRVLLALHAVAAPLLFVPMLDAVGPVDGAARTLASALPARAGAQVVLVNAPLELLTNYALAVRECTEFPPPDALHALYAGGASVAVERVDERTLELHVPRGWAWAPIERIFMSRAHAPGVGAVRKVHGMEVYVLETASSGMPSRVRFVFPTALEDERRTWLAWVGAEPQPWHPPPIGKRVELPGLPFVTSMRRAGSLSSAR